MKNKWFLLSFVLLAFFVSLAYPDEIHKKDGSILMGKIIEVIPNESYKIELDGGSIFVVRFDEVQKAVFSEIKKDAPQAEQTKTGPISKLFKHHHITVAGGYYKALSDDLKLDEFGVDLTDAGLGVFEYRYSFNKKLDGVVSSRAWLSSDRFLGGTINIISSFWGVGVRSNMNIENQDIHIFFQAMLYVVSEELEATGGGRVSENTSQIGVGSGFSAGIDIPAGDLISIPLEVSYIVATGEGNRMDDLSGFGISTGVNFNF